MACVEVRVGTRMVTALARNRGAEAPSRSVLLAALSRHGAHSASYVLLEGGKQYATADGVDGFLGYDNRGGVTVIAGDPVCAPADAPRLIATLLAQRGRRPVCAIGVRAEMLPAFRACGFDAVSIGSEAVFDLQRFTLSGGPMAAVRAACNKATREGVRVTEYHPAPGPDPVADELCRVSAEWMGAKGGVEHGFLLGGLSLGAATAKRYFIARAGDGHGRVEGFIVCEPVYARRGWYLDVTRRRIDAVRGTMELLTTDILATLARQGYAMATLGLAPLGDVSADDAHRHPHFARGARFVYEHLNRPIDFKGLHQYKRKYHPHAWERRYLCFRRCIGPRLLYAALAVRHDARPPRLRWPSVPRNPRAAVADGAAPLHRFSQEAI